MRFGAYLSPLLRSLTTQGEDIGRALAEASLADQQASLSARG